MRPSLLLVCALTLSGAQASWFGSDAPAYKSWDEVETRAWLEAHNIQAPKGYSKSELQNLVKANWNSASSWTADQYYKAQQVFADVKDSTFDTWDESRLREFLLEQGVVQPSGPRESLALMAKQKYRAYTSAASSFSSSVSTAASTAVYGDRTQQASKSATSLASQASQSATSIASQASASAASAYTVASNSASSVVAAATTPVTRKLDETKDYVYSSWDDSALRAYLEEKGVVEPKAKTTREQLLSYMQDTYAKTANPVWRAWSDSYTREWLVTHHLLKSDEQKQREALQDQMARYYYDTKETVYSSWDESQLKQWLIEHNIVKSDAQVEREKLQRLVADNYANAQDTIWASWKDSDMRDWLIEHGYLRTDAQKSRDELIRLMNQKYDNASTRTADYLVWPDARLRAYLRNRGLSEGALPTSRPGLLQEVRIRWVQTNSRVEALYEKIRENLYSGVELAEEKLGQILSVLTGSAHSAASSASSAGASATGKVAASASSASAKAAASASSASLKAAASASSASAKGSASASSATKAAKETAYDAKAAAADSKEQKKGWLKGKASSVSVESAKNTAKVKGEL
ncbi:hypothetical protein PUNSTDRAFT_54757 [Punctularia strigosozonata HHB-11173 SS5]|uniref:uncharacterized protein n=1 Tax=Punctularia strigosozonata (strain HHB-11173) TaxID=741275 RepID=UPI000441818A|nr:uncharacterized protein PUNSTDRAFT_54757 [Punctularia strigosozonata HHB-11173 SS5]EIN05924.1 hypothetical protein PUNSTDRAFT_54757 [Punctularia strigosozonata HHB-11173 SS5]